MAAKKAGQRRSVYYARIGKIGGEATKRKHSRWVEATPRKRRARRPRR